MYGEQRVPDIGEATLDEYEVPTERATLDPLLAEWLKETYRLSPLGPPSVLEVECGTGALMESVYLSTKLYAGVDANRANLTGLWFYRDNPVELHLGDWRDLSALKTYGLVAYVNPGAAPITSSEVEAVAQLVCPRGRMLVRTEEDLGWGWNMPAPEGYRVWRRI